MTEIEWFAASDVDRMLTFVRNRASDRKLRLFASACLRQMEHVLPNDSALRVLRVSEQCADGEASQEELDIAAEESNESGWDRARGYSDLVFAYGTEAIELICHSDAFQAAACVSDQVVAALVTASPASGVGDSVRAAQCDLARCIFGNPVRPVSQIMPSPIPVELVRRALKIYQDSAFERMPELGEELAMLNAANDAVQHCHSPLHGRGCWVVDQIIGKN